MSNTMTVFKKLNDKKNDIHTVHGSSNLEGNKLLS